MVKIDLGAHMDGYIVVAAHTLIVKETPVAGTVMIIILHVCVCCVREWVGDMEVCVLRLWVSMWAYVCCTCAGYTHSFRCGWRSVLSY